jgi:hypothetical protein
MMPAVTGCCDRHSVENLTQVMRFLNKPDVKMRQLMHRGIKCCRNATWKLVDQQANRDGC